MEQRTKIFVNVAVRDLEKSKSFFSKLGFSFNPQFTDQNAACMVIGDDSFIMLLAEDFFRTFTRKEIADTSRSTEAIIALSADSRETVDKMVTTALESGGKKSNEPYELEGMYGWSFQDPDGHLWEVIYMDPNVFRQG